MGRQRRWSGPSGAAWVVVLGVVLSAVVVLVGFRLVMPDVARVASRPTVAPSYPVGGLRPSRAPTAATEPAPTPDEVRENGMGGNANEEAFYLWADRHRVGSLNLPAMGSAEQRSAVARGYCDQLSEEPNHSGRAVTGVIRAQTGATWAEARELLERSVAGFCPHKARHLV